MKDNRRYNRYSLNMKEINGHMLRTTHVKIINMGLGGICIKADRRLNIGSEYSLKLKDKGKGLLLRGAVVWSSLIECRENESGERIPIYQAGMKYTDHEVVETHELLSFIERNKVHAFAALKGIRINVMVSRHQMH